MKSINLRNWAYRRKKILLQKINHLKFGERQENSYATHLPVVIGLAKILRITNILELGSGFYSTPAFLNKNIFPHLKKLVSIEDDLDWVAKVKEFVKPDTRFEFIASDVPISLLIPGMDLSIYDLIFVDNSTDDSERTETIEHIESGNISDSLVLIHDFERKNYQKAARLFKRSYSFFALNPAVGIVWNNRSVNILALIMIDLTIRFFASRVDPGDVTRWSQVLDKTLFFTK